MERLTPIDTAATVLFRSVREPMKYLATLALILNLGVAPAYAQDESVKMSFSGNGGPSAIDLKQPNSNNVEENVAGTGTLGPFTFRDIRAAATSPQPSSTCSGAFFPNVAGNAILNYIYALLESESRLALATLGLDPGLGVLHNDLRGRDSLASDLMEPVRPKVDAFVLKLLTSERLRREWFFEQRDGNCRLMASFAAILSETALMWRTAVASYAEWIAKSFWDSRLRPIRSEGPATRLTQRQRSEGRAILAGLDQTKDSSRLALCRICGHVRPASNGICRDCR